eukprot:1100409-Pelagomonas_calceolata.AAC.1
MAHVVCIHCVMALVICTQGSCHTRSRYMSMAYVMCTHSKCNLYSWHMSFALTPSWHVSSALTAHDRSTCHLHPLPHRT